MEVGAHLFNPPPRLVVSVRRGVQAELFAKLSILYGLWFTDMQVLPRVATYHLHHRQFLPPFFIAIY